jgi:hypothetical protein
MYTVSMWAHDGRSFIIRNAVVWCSSDGGRSVRDVRAIDNATRQLARSLATLRSLYPPCYAPLYPFTASPLLASC